MYVSGATINHPNLDGIYHPLIYGNFGGGLPLRFTNIRFKTTHWLTQ